MSKQMSTDELDAYIDDLILYRQDHEKDDPLQVASALIYAIQTRENFNEQFSYYLKNVSYTEKKQIKKIIEFNSGKPLSEAQQKLYDKLIESLPSDKVAKSNEERRKLELKDTTQSVTEFLQTGESEIAKLKRKIGEELRKKNVDHGAVNRLSLQIHELRDKLIDLTTNSNPAIQKQARKLLSTFEIPIDEETQKRTGDIDEGKARFQVKINNLKTLTAQIHPDMSPEEVNRIQERLATNNYAYHYLPAIRIEAEKGLKALKEIRQQQLSKVQGEEMSFLKALKTYKTWSESSEFELKYGHFSTEHMREGFYVMRGPAKDEPKNDIKMHVSVDSNQAGIALEIISELAQSEKYMNLIREYKIGDVDHITKSIKTNMDAAKSALKRQIEQLELPYDEHALDAFLKSLVENPDKDAVMRDFLANVPDEKRNLLGNVIQDVVKNNIEAVISGQRILNEALFTVYFKDGMSKEELDDFSKELNQRLSAKGVEPGQTALTDVAINPYCKVTIDHIVENGKKAYLDGSDPKQVEKRRIAMRENPVTEEIVAKVEGVTMHVSRMQAMALHEDAKDMGGMSAFIAKGMLEVPLQDRVQFAGLLVQERFKHTENVNLVYRNPEMFSKWVVKEILSDMKFPVDPDDKSAFFALVEKATASPVDEIAKTQLQQMFKEPNDLIVKMLLPFYHDYIESVKKEFDLTYKEDESRPKDERRRDYYDAREKRLDEAKKQFIGHVSFPFVESLVFELMEKDNFNPLRKAKLAQAFRSLREKGMMDDLKTALDKQNEGFVQPKPDPDTVNKVYQIYQKGRVDFMQFQREHHEKMAIVEDRVTELYKVVNKIAAFYPKDSDLKAKMEGYAGSIENLKTELYHMLLRGEKVTENEIQEVLVQFDSIMSEVKKQVNTVNERNETVLHEAIRAGHRETVEALLKAGANPEAPTTHYSRSLGRVIQDFFKGQTKSSPISARKFAQKMGMGEVFNTQEIKPIESQIIAQLDKALEEVKVEEEKEVSIKEKPSVVTFQSKREEHKPDSPFYENAFAAGWIHKMDEMLKELKHGTATTQQNKAVAGAIVEIQNFMSGIIAKKTDVTPDDLAMLNKVITRVKGQFFTGLYELPEPVKEMMDKMEKGVVVPVEKPVSLRELGPKTTFVEKWEAYLSKVKEENTIPSVYIQALQDHFYANPGTDEGKLDGLLRTVKRLEDSVNVNNENLKSLFESLKKGEVPDEPKEKPKVMKT